MKVLITGANGFVGRALVQKFSELPLYEITLVLRSLGAYKDSEYTIFKIDNLDSAVNFSYALKNVEVVVHIAARAHILKEDSSNPLEEFNKINVDGTLNLAKQALNNGVKRFIFISTIGVYGSKSVRPFTEQNSVEPENDYARSKLQAEEQLKKLVNGTSMDLVILRPPLVYGANAPGNFGKIFNLVTKNIPLPFGSVHNKRSMVYVENLVDFIIHCVDHPAAANQTFLVSDNDDISLTRLITTIRKCAGMPKLLLPVPVFLFKLAGKLTGKQAVVDRLVGDLQVDSSKARTLLNWQPPFTFEEGIAATVKYFQSQDK